MSKFIDCERNQAFLLPPDLRDWIPEDDLAHFVIEAVERVEMSAFKVNHRGTGSAQYHPRMMLALLIYCYANGIFSSRRIERATHRDIGVRFVAANVHPDHDTIATFRRDNLAAFGESFLQVLLLAKELKLVKVGLVSVDGSKFEASASKHRSVTYERAGELIDQLKLDIADLMERAAAADGEGEDDPQALPKEIARREALCDRLDAARRRLEARAKARAEAERADYEAKVAARDKRTGRAKGKHPKPPDETPRASEQSNLSDPDSRLMRKSKRHEYRQAYNAQAVVDAGGSQLIVGARLTNCASDRNELVADIAAIPAELGRPKTVLADNGYANGDEVAALAESGIEALVSTAAEGRRAGLRHHQGGARLHRLLAARPRQGGRRVGLGGAGLQLQAPAQAQAGDGRVTALLARQADPKARPQPRSLGDPPPHRSVRTHPRGFAELRSRL